MCNFQARLKTLPPERNPPFRVAHPDSPCGSGFDTLLRAGEMLEHSDSPAALVPESGQPSGLAMPRANGGAPVAGAQSAAPAAHAAPAGAAAQRAALGGLGPRPGPAPSQQASAELLAQLRMAQNNRAAHGGSAASAPNAPATPPVSTGHPILSPQIVQHMVQLGFVQPGQAIRPAVASPAQQPGRSSMAYPFHMAGSGPSQQQLSAAMQIVIAASRGQAGDQRTLHPALQQNPMRLPAGIPQAMASAGMALGAAQLRPELQSMLPGVYTGGHGPQQQQRPVGPHCVGPQQPGQARPQAPTGGPLQHVQHMLAQLQADAQAQGRALIGVPRSSAVTQVGQAQAHLRPPFPGAVMHAVPLPSGPPGARPPRQPISRASALAASQALNSLPHLASIRTSPAHPILARAAASGQADAVARSLVSSGQAGQHNLPRFSPAGSAVTTGQPQPQGQPPRPGAAAGVVNGQAAGQKRAAEPPAAGDASAAKRLRTEPQAPARTPLPQYLAALSAPSASPTAAAAAAPSGHLAAGSATYVPERALPDALRVCSALAPAWQCAVEGFH